MISHRGPKALACPGRTHTIDILTMCGFVSRREPAIARKTTKQHREIRPLFPHNDLEENPLLGIG